MKADKRLLEKRMEASWRDLATDEDSREEVMMKIHDILKFKYLHETFYKNKCFTKQL